MRSSDDITPIDELIAQACRIPLADDTERAHLGAARRELDLLLDGMTPARAIHGGEWRRWRHSLASVPVIATCLVVVLIAVVALTALRPRPVGGHGSLSGPAATHSADALIAKLAVLRRPQTRADQLPANLEINQAPNGIFPRGNHLGVIIPSLSRLVAIEPGARLYLVVTTPVGGRQPLWTASLGDQVTILAVTTHGATETPGYPAVELSDASQLIRAGYIPSRYAYDVAIVSDGVARVQWTFANRAGGPGRTITAPVTNNVAITHLTSSTAFLLRATWYASDGSVIPTSNAALEAAEAARTAAEGRQALRRAERQRVTVPASLLDAFAVFSIKSPTGTKTSSGYIISHPPLSSFPLAILQLSTRSGQLDLRQARRVIAPSGREMWAIPGKNGICVWAINAFTGLRRQVIGRGAAGTCSNSIQQAESEGSGLSASSSTSKGSVIYGIVPRTTHAVTIQTGSHTHRTIHPVDGVYITTTPFRYG